MTVAEEEVMSLSPIPSPGSSNTADETSTTASADSPVSGHDDEPTTPHDTLTPVSVLVVYCSLFIIYL